MRFVALALATLALAAVPLAQETAEDPDLEQDAAVTFGGLVQTQFSTSNAAGADDTELSLRRVRLSANARLTPVLSARIQAELANAAVGGAAELNEAYALAQLTPAVGVLVGKGGRPFGIVDATAAANLTPIERGARFRGADAVAQYRVLEALAYAGRSVGVQVLGEGELAGVGVAYAAGYFAGATGEEGGDADIQQLAARVQVSPLPRVKVAVAATSRAFARDDPPGLDAGTFGGATGADPVGETRRGAGFAVDAEYGETASDGLHLLAEVAVGTLDPFTDDRFRTAQAWGGYRVGLAGPLVAGVEPILRVSIADADGPLGASEGVLVTPGLNVYGPDGARLALNVDLFRPSNADADGERETLVAFRAQVQIAF